MPRVAVVGGGPGGLAAARHLRGSSGGGVEVILFERQPAVEYLPGAIPVALGRGRRNAWRAPLRPDGFTVRTGRVTGVSGAGVTLDGEFVEADAVICAPGLALEDIPATPNTVAFWDPAGAEAAADALDGFEGGTIAVVISSLPYRCPPAPFGLAMELAARYRDRAKVMLTTPESVPLAAVGGGVPQFLVRSCADAGLDLLPDFEPDLHALQDGVLRSTTGAELRSDLALVVPPHVRSPLLAALPGDGPLVPVSSRYESAEAGLFVVGDAAMAPLPRAADAAAAGGRTAADAVLNGLGTTAEAEPHRPEPECLVGHGGGRYSRISLRYPDGLPPAGAAEVRIEGPSEALVAGFWPSFER